MARLYFENLTRTVQIGGSVAGTLVVEADAPVDPNAISVDLLGAEKAFVEWHDRAGERDEPPSGLRTTKEFLEGEEGTRRVQEPVTDVRKFLETRVTWEEHGQQLGLVYRLPFSFPIPVGSVPSMRTGVLTVSGRRGYRAPNFGMFVEYTLEGRVQHPQWVDQVDLELIRVLPSVTQVGFLPSLRLDDPKRSVTLMVNPESTAITPGASLSGFFEVLNPQRTRLEKLTVALVRRVQYSAQGIAHTLNVPRYEQSIDVPHDSEKFAGRFSFPIPDDEDAIPAARGTLFQTQWWFEAQLKGGLLSEPISVEALVAPPPSAAGTGPP